MLARINNRISLKIALTISLILTVVIVSFSINRHLEQKYFLEVSLKNKGKQLAETLSLTYLNTLQLHNWQSVYDAVINLKKNDPEIVAIYFTEPTSKISISSDPNLEGKSLTLIKLVPETVTFAKQIISRPSPLIATVHVVLSTEELKKYTQSSTKQTIVTTLAFTLISFILSYLVSKKFITAYILHNTLMNEHEKQITNALIANASSTLAHSLKNPLGIIRALSLQLENKKLSEEISRMYGTIDQLKHVAPKPVKFSSFKMELILEMALKQSLAANDPLSQIKIIKDYDHDLPKINVDIEQLKTALGDLIDNALQAMPETNPELILKLKKQPDHISLEIIDNGCGIVQGSQNELFKPFFTTKKAGTGLGLWGAKRVIEEIHAGKITVDSSATHGTNVKIRLGIS